jgi:oligopeptide transport system substrate-binding protein
MRRRWKKASALALSALTATTVLGGCGKGSDGVGEYTYRDVYETAPSTWNPHTYRTRDDAYVNGYTTLGLYDFFFNEDYSRYEVRPEMAAAEPIDVTERYKSEEKWGIPQDADSGYAYEIPLNPLAKWEDGTPINAETYVYSMQRLLDPELLNYRASNYYTGNLVIKNAEKYNLGKADDEAEEIPFTDVGIFTSGEYSFTIVLEKALKGFYLLYSLSDNWIVKKDLYEAALSGGDGYNTTKETTSSYGPYKLTQYLPEQQMTFEKNNEWYGWTDEKHGGMYAATRIIARRVAEASTRKQMFLRGELETYGLQAEDYAEYRSSDYAHSEPGQTVFFLILCGDEKGLQLREGAGVQKRILSLETFRKAMAVTYQKEFFASTISPARSGAYGLLGRQDVWNVETGEAYRDTPQAKQVLCDFYGVDVADFGGDLDAAAASITGYDPALAGELFKQAFAEAKAKFGMKDSDRVEIEYAVATSSAFITKTIDYLNGELEKVLAPAGLSGRVRIVESVPYGNTWQEKIRGGQSDTVLAGWTGGILNPFNTIQYYTNPLYEPYANAWYDTRKIEATLEIDSVPVTLTLTEWGEALNGQAIERGGKTYNFGYGIATDETRLKILAAVEGKILSGYSYIPMLQDGSFYLLSQKVRYPTEEYDPVLGYGGVKYLRFGFDDAEWAKFVKRSGGQLNYK